jgi:general stress protein YciG
MILTERSAALEAGIGQPAAGRGGFDHLEERIMASNNQGNKQSSGTKNRGFASMDPERQRQIASQGGKAAHEKGTAHEFTSEEARRAGSMSHGNRQSASNSSSSRSSSKGNK